MGSANPDPGKDDSNTGSTGVFSQTGSYYTRSKSGWVPTTSTAVGAIIGTAIAQIIVAIFDAFLAHPLTPELSSAVTTLCIFGAGYVIKDGGRR